MIRAIWAQARTGAIGAGGDMPWDVPEDLAHFKRATAGHPVVMGRRTWISFPDQWRPLPGRANIVVTRDTSFAADGASVVHSLEEGIELARGIDEDVWIIGGGQVYEQALPVTEELWVTEIDVAAEGDAHAPEIAAPWRVVSADPPAPGWHTSTTGTRYRFLVYRR